MKILDYNILILATATNLLFIFFLLHTQKWKGNAAVAKAVDKAGYHYLCGSIQAITQCQQVQHIFISVAAVLTSLATSCYCPAD